MNRLVSKNGLRRFVKTFLSTAIFTFFALVVNFVFNPPNTYAAYAQSTLAPTSCGPSGVSFDYLLTTTSVLSQTSGFNNFFWYPEGGDPENPSSLPLSVISGGMGGSGTITLDPADYTDGEVINIVGSFVQWDEVINGTQVCDLDPVNLNDPGVPSCGQTLAATCTFSDPAQNQCIPNISNCDPATQNCYCQFDSDCCNNYCDPAWGYCKYPPGATVPPMSESVRCDTGGTFIDDGINTAIGCIPFLDRNAFAGFILRWGIGVGGGIAFLLILYSGFMIITSSGSPERLKAGQELLTAAITGLLLLLFSVFILEFIGINIVGIPNFGS